MSRYLLVALGGALGGPARLLTGQLLAGLGGGLPWGTIVANVLGSLLIGLVAGATASPTLRLLLMTGFCGGYTTFSAFSLETLRLLQQGATSAALGNIALSLLACLLAVWLGDWLARALSPRP